MGVQAVRGKRIQSSMTFGLEYLNMNLPPPDRRYIVWLSFVAVAYNYNAWFCTARLAFPYHNPTANMYWVICDILSDLVYLIDIVVWQPRLQFVKGGDIIVSHDAKNTNCNCYLIAIQACNYCCIYFAICCVY